MVSWHSLRTARRPCPGQFLPRPFARGGSNNRWGVMKAIANTENGTDMSRDVFIGQLLARGPVMGM